MPGSPANTGGDFDNPSASAASGDNGMPIPTTPVPNPNATSSFDAAPSSQSFLSTTIPSPPPTTVDDIGASVANDAINNYNTAALHAAGSAAADDIAAMASAWVARQNPQPSSVNDLLMAAPIFLTTGYKNDGLATTGSTNTADGHSITGDQFVAQTVQPVVNAVQSVVQPVVDAVQPVVQPVINAAVRVDQFGGQLNAAAWGQGWVAPETTSLVGVMGGSLYASGEPV